jgi:hypothetical protein
MNGVGDSWRQRGRGDGLGAGSCARRMAEIALTWYR